MSIYGFFGCIVNSYDNIEYIQNQQSAGNQQNSGLLQQSNAILRQQTFSQSLGAWGLDGIYPFYRKRKCIVKYGKYE